MASKTSMDHYQQELGKLLCDRAGLDPNRVLRDFEIDDANGKEAMVTLPSVVFIPTEDLAELRHLAAERALK